MLNLVVVEGEGAINNIRQRTAREPIIQVEDENHKPIAGAIVTFTLPERGAGGLFSNGAHTLTVTTNQQGQAVASGFRPNAVRGQFQIRVNANYQGRTGNTTIHQSNALVGAATGAATGGILSAKLIGILVAVGAAAVGGAVYATHNGGGSSSTSTSTANSPTSVTAGAGTVGPPR